MTVRQLKELLDAAKDTDYVYFDGQQILSVDYKTGCVILSRHLFETRMKDSVVLGDGQEYEFDWSTARKIK